MLYASARRAFHSGGCRSREITSVSIGATMEPQAEALFGGFRAARPPQFSNLPETAAAPAIASRTLLAPGGWPGLRPHRQHAEYKTL